MDNNFDDLEYISRVLRGDSKAFEKIIEKYQLLIKKLAYNYLYYPEDVLDASQDIFMEIYKSLSNFDLSKQFLPWIYSIALNTLKKKYQRKIREQKIKTSAAEVKRMEIQKEMALSDNREERMQIKKIVNELPAALKEVVILYYYENLKVKEISEILKISHENIKSRLFRARKKLKQNLIDMQPF